MSLAPGVRLGAYQVTSLLGSGGMGEVYRAHDGRLGRDVAVKVLPAAVAGDEERLRRFELEARAAGASTTPTCWPSTSWAATTACPSWSPSCSKARPCACACSQGPCRRPAPWTWPCRWRAAWRRPTSAASCTATSSPRTSSSPTAVGRGDIAKILDFGLAKLEPELAGTGLDGAPTMTRGTTPGSVLGSVGYMAPEQVRGQPADHRSDIFSLGAILYEMLAGRRAFRGDSAVETLNAILKEDPAELSASGRLIPPALERVVRHCLEKRPDERFQSARDLVFDLEALSAWPAAARGWP